jgi:hypothetical protein
MCVSLKVEYHACACGGDSEAGTRERHDVSKRQVPAYMADAWPFVAWLVCDEEGVGGECNSQNDASGCEKQASPCDDPWGCAGAGFIGFAIAIVVDAIAFDFELLKVLAVAFVAFCCAVFPAFFALAYFEEPVTDAIA